MSRTFGTFDLSTALPKRYLLTFVYGTLRPGEGNYWIEPAVLQVWEDCTTPGVMFARGIPFCDFRDHSHGLITGTLLLMDRRHRLTDQMIGMELGARYVELDVPVTVPSERDLVITAKAWHYPRAEGMARNERVKSGNFRDTPGSRYFNGHVVPYFDDDEDDEDVESADGGKSSVIRWWEDVLG